MKASRKHEVEMTGLDVGEAIRRYTTGTIGIDLDVEEIMEKLDIDDTMTFTFRREEDVPPVRIPRGVNGFDRNTNGIDG